MIKPTAALAMLLTAGYASTATAATSDAKEKDNSYPLSVCLVSDEKLGSMGEPHVIQYKAREIKFCCAHCEKGFRKEPQKYLAKLDKAANSAAATQPTAEAND